ncbi:MAG: peptide-methionine (S)-S-oxide reductase MsrA [Clostridia bacterium]|nr:peptide-methionine (S)-S-oxide reductase MsrA [Clostridia bacterium]
MKSAYFAGGCFWCITPVFAETDGVISVTSGYCGGDEADPSYEDVKAQKTGHRETVKIDYDENVLSYSTLLQIFFENVDITDGGGQYIDRGHSYTLAVYYTDETEKEEALLIIKKLGCENTVAAEKYKRFYTAEEYHQDFYKKEPEKYKEEIEISGRKIK